MTITDGRRQEIAVQILLPLRLVRRAGGGGVCITCARPYEFGLDSAVTKLLTDFLAERGFLPAVHTTRTEDGRAIRLTAWTTAHPDEAQTVAGVFRRETALPWGCPLPYCEVPASMQFFVDRRGVPERPVPPDSLAARIVAATTTFWEDDHAQATKEVPGLRDADDTGPHVPDEAQVAPR